MKWLNKLLNRFKNKIHVRSRKVTKAKFLYLYIIIGAPIGLGYGIVSLFVDILPTYLAFTPLYLLVGFAFYQLLVKNWSVIWLYIRDVEQGKLLLFLNKNTHWNKERKLKVVAWVYLRRKTIRQETHAEISAKVMEGTTITNIEKKSYGFKVVICPQQILLGFNEPMLVNALIYAHNNIQVLDQELRDIMELTDEHILAFDLNKEFKKAGGDEYLKYMEIGERMSQNLN